MNLIPKHLLGFFRRKKRAEDESRLYAVDLAFNLTIQELARHKGRSEEDVLIELAEVGKEQLRNDKEMVARWNSLTLREQEVVALVCLGVRNYQIADTLGITYGTVKSHFQNIFHKFNVRERKAIRIALKDWDFESWWMKDPHRRDMTIPRGTAFE